MCKRKASTSTSNYILRQWNKDSSSKIQIANMKLPLPLKSLFQILQRDEQFILYDWSPIQLLLLLPKLSSGSNSLSQRVRSRAVFPLPKQYIRINLFFNLFLSSGKISNKDFYNLDWLYYSFCFCTSNILHYRIY